MSKRNNTEPLAERPIDRHLRAFNDKVKYPARTGFFYISIPLLIFAISGLIWFLPFPVLSFLGQYQGYINWFTLFMAGMIYAYLKLSPTLSYVMLFTFGIFSYLIVQLEYWEKLGGPAPWGCCLGIGILGLVSISIDCRMKGRSISLKELTQVLFLGPIWLWSLLLQKVKIPF